MTRPAADERPHGRELHRSLALVTVAGCLAMVFMVGVGSPMATDYFRSLGLTEFHFGILGGLPMIMISMQFVGALWGNRLGRRRPAFMALVIGGRALWLGVILAPLALTGGASSWRAWAVVTAVALSSLFLNLAPPIWFSWMADLVPRRILSRYWGGRMRWTWIAWLATHGLLILLSSLHARLGLDLSGAFALVVTLAVTAGVVDILLFLWVREPPAAPVRGRPVLSTLLEPLRERDYRSYLVWNCAFSAAAMIGASFMQLYVLKVLGLPLWVTMLIWWTPGMGSALSSGFWGRLIDRYGSRPVLLVCTCAKPLAPLVFALITRETAFWVLPPFFMLDAVLNAGNQLATNGFMLRTAPRRNRGMFTAAMSSLPGISAGLATILGGWLLHQWEGHRVEALGRVWINYQFLFLLSCALRVMCIPLALRIREPRSGRPLAVLSAVANVWPLRLVLLPVRLYRRIAANRKSSPRAPTGGRAGGGPAPPADGRDAPGGSLDSV